MKVNEWLSMTPPLSLLLVLRTHWQVGLGTSDRQLPRVNLGPEVATVLLRILSGSNCGNPEILGDGVSLKNVFSEELAATFGWT